MLALDSETIVHCAVCSDEGMVTVEAADRCRDQMRARYGGAKGFRDDGRNLRPMSLRADLCPCCDGLSPGIDIAGENIVHCPVCFDLHPVTPEQIKAYEEEMRARYGKRHSSRAR